MTYDEKWWNDGIGYMIYPLSFLDMNDDGYGDLRGIISKVPYLKELGVGFLYLCPIFSSPMKDCGYDVDNYYEINPKIGNMDDLQELIKVLHEHGMHLILDLPLNHTSSEHPSFQKALKDENASERNDFYFVKGKYEGGKLLPPNNWPSFFGGSAWENVDGSDYFYLHLFSKYQPDLNWSSKDVRKKLADVALFYANLGVDGFRLDACSHFAKDLSFEDSLEESGEATYEKFSNRLELLGYLKDFRSYLPDDVLLIGESGGYLQPNESLKFVNKEDGPMNMLFNFDTVNENGSYESFDKNDDEIKTDVISLKENFMRWYNALAKNADMPIYWENHDGPRVLSQYGSIKYRDKSAKMLLTTLLFFYGTPFIQYGDEIGMSNLSLERIEDFNLDPTTNSEVDSWREKGYSDDKILRYLNRTSRLSSRSLMQWNKGINAGFSNAIPYMPLNPNYLEGVDIESQMSDPYSILNFFQYAFEYRKNRMVNESVLHGQLRIIDHNHPDVFAYMHDGPIKLMVISNMRDHDVYFSFYNEIVDVKLHNYGDVILEDHVFKLRPFETFLLIVR